MRARPHFTDYRKNDLPKISCIIPITRVVYVIYSVYVLCVQKYGAHVLSPPPAPAAGFVRACRACVYYAGSCLLQEAGTKEGVSSEKRLRKSNLVYSTRACCLWGGGTRSVYTIYTARGKSIVHQPTPKQNGRTERDNVRKHSQN